MLIGDANPIVILINEMDKEVIQRATVSFERLVDSHTFLKISRMNLLLKKAFLDKAKTLYGYWPDSSGLLPHEDPDEDKTGLNVPYCQVHS